MDKDAADQIANLISTFYKEVSLKPFPYIGIRKLLRQYPNINETLIADLDWFDSTIDGYSSRINSIQNWAYLDAKQAVSLLSRSFYDKHPEYLSLQPILAKAPDLDEDIDVHEKMRQALLLLLADRLQQPI